MFSLRFWSEFVWGLSQHAKHSESVSTLNV